MISAYIDASGLHETPVLCVAGWVSHDFLWEAFNLEWQPYLAQVRGRFDWSQPSSAEARQVLAGLISKYAMAGVAITVDKAEFDQSTGNDFKSRHGNAYSAALQGLIYTLGDWSSHYGLGPIAYFVEAGDDGQAHAARWFGRINASPTTKKYVNLSGFSLVKKDCPPVHASDLLAYEVTRQYPAREGLLLDWSQVFRDFYILGMGADGLTIAEMCAQIIKSDRVRANEQKRRKWLERKRRDKR